MNRCLVLALGLLITVGCRNSQPRTDPFLFGRTTVPPPATGAGVPGALTAPFASTSPYNGVPSAGMPTNTIPSTTAPAYGVAGPAGTTAPYGVTSPYGATTPYGSTVPYGVTTPYNGATATPGGTPYAAGMPGYGGVLPQNVPGANYYNPPGGSFTPNTSPTQPTYPGNTVPYLPNTAPQGTTQPYTYPQGARPTTSQTPTIRAGTNGTRVSQVPSTNSGVVFADGRMASENPATNPLLPVNYNAGAGANAAVTNGSSPGWQQPRSTTDIMNLPPARPRSGPN